MKKLLTSAPVLNIVDPKKDFVVCTNDCIEELCGVIMQVGFVICYESRNLKEHEKNYATHDLELASIVQLSICEEITCWEEYSSLGHTT